MKTASFAGALALVVCAATATAQTPSWSVPPESARCPSKWGAGDERGSANLMKPQRVLDTVKLIKTGEIIELAHVLGPTMPFSQSGIPGAHAQGASAAAKGPQHLKFPGKNEGLVVLGERP